MIKEMIMYTLVCDKCGTDILENDEASCYADQGYLYGLADDSDWKTIFEVTPKDKHYCPDCYYIDDNDKLTIK